MSFDQIVQLISSVGFPIVMCGALCFYVYKNTTSMQSAIEKLEDAIKELIIKLDKDDKDKE